MPSRALVPITSSPSIYHRPSYICSHAYADSQAQLQTLIYNWPLTGRIFSHSTLCAKRAIPHQLLSSSLLSASRRLMLSSFRRLIIAYTRTLMLTYCHTLTLSYSHTLVLSYSQNLILSYSHTLIVSYSHTLLI